MHNGYPLAPENLKLVKICWEDIAAILQINKYRIKIENVNKLVPNWGNKSKYVFHYRNLPLYLSLGMTLVSIHKALKFKQSDWLKKYIDFNTNKS